MKKYKVTLILLAISLVSYGLYHIQGAKVLADGTLSEPFYLVGIGGISLVLAGLSGLIISLKNLIKK